MTTLAILLLALALLGVGLCGLLLARHARALRRLERTVADLQRARTVLYRVNGRVMSDQEVH